MAAILACIYFNTNINNSSHLSPKLIAGFPRKGPLTNKWFSPKQKQNLLEKHFISQLTFSQLPGSRFRDGVSDATLPFSFLFPSRIPKACVFSSSSSEG